MLNFLKYLQKNILKSLNLSKAVGIDKLSGKFLKDGAGILARPISQICNLSVKLSSFSRSCKIAKIKPLLKRAPKLTFHQGSILSKIIESIIYDQTE